MIKCSILLLFTSCIFLLANTLDAQSYYPAYNFTTFAGNPGLGNVDASGSAASFNHPAAVASDSSGNVFVADTVDNTIRKITPAGVVTTFAGSPGIIGSADGTGSSASFNHPTGIAVDSNGTVFVADLGNSTVRKITSAGVVSTLAGTAGNSGYKDATGSAALFSTPIGVAVDSSGNVYVSDRINHVVRMIDTKGTVHTIAGNGTSGNSGDGGSALNATFSTPACLFVNSLGNLFICDPLSSVVRVMNVNDATAPIQTLAGNGTQGYSGDGSLATKASLNNPSSVWQDATGVIYIADMGNMRIRSVLGAKLSKETASVVNIYPNPSNGNFKVLTNATAGDATLEVVNVLGELVHTEKLNAQQTVVNLNLPAGVYNVVLKSGGSSTTQKIVIEK